MDDVNNNYGKWIVYGWSAKCSNCGFVRIGVTNVCQRCGTIMNREIEHFIPNMDRFKEIELPVYIKCNQCGNEMYELKSTVCFCNNCGAKINGEVTE